MGEMRALPKPEDLPNDSRIAPTELTTFTVDVQVSEFKLEDDSDVYVVIHTVRNPEETMIVELPDVGCTGAANSPQAAAMQKARKDFVAICGQPSGVELQALHRDSEVTGVGFFDFKHGQTGVAPNGIELHPVLAIQEAKLSASPTGAPPTPAAIISVAPKVAPPQPTVALVPQNGKLRPELQRRNRHGNRRLHPAGRGRLRLRRWRGNGPNYMRGPVTHCWDRRVQSRRQP